MPSTLHSFADRSVHNAVARQQNFLAMRCNRLVLSVHFRPSRKRSLVSRSIGRVLLELR